LLHYLTEANDVVGNFKMLYQCCRFVIHSDETGESFKQRKGPVTALWWGTVGNFQMPIRHFHLFRFYHKFA